MYSIIPSWLPWKTTESTKESSNHYNNKQSDSCSVMQIILIKYIINSLRKGKLVAIGHELTISPSNPYKLQRTYSPLTNLEANSCAALFPYPLQTWAMLTTKHELFPDFLVSYESWNFELSRHINIYPGNPGPGCIKLW